MKRSFFLVLLIVCISVSNLSAQNFKGIYVDESQNGIPLTELFDEVEQTHGVSIIYEKNVLEGYTVFGIGKRYKLEDFLEVFLPSYKPVKVSSSEMIIVEDRIWEKYGFVQKNYLTFQLVDDHKQKISGNIYDANTLDPIIGAEIYLPTLKTGTLTNTEGYFEFELDEGIYELEVRYTGYDSETKLIAFGSQGKPLSDIYLFEASTQLDNITITAETQDKNVMSLATGVERMGIEKIRTLPTFMGEVDPIKGLITLPGVSTVGELSAGFNVRGGDAGQNLILQDEGIIYNPTHLFGFFSAFNPDMVQDVKLLKGGGPATFGGRASSVLDIGLRNGESSNHTFTGGIGLISSRLAVEGPIKRNKTSYLIGGRISYTDWLLHSLNNLDLNNSSSSFYDITGKIFHIQNEKNFYTLTGYYSTDDFNFGTDSTYSWTTANVSLVWDHTFNEKATSKLSVASSNYKSNLLNSDVITAFDYQNSINNLKLKYLVDLKSESHVYNFGVETNGSVMNPGQLDPKVDNGVIPPQDISDQNALEFAAFVNGDFNFSEKWGMSLGIRYSSFLRLGKGEIYSFDYDNLDGRYPSIIDTTYYSEGEIISSYGGFEPRISLRYLLNQRTSLKASYYRTRQYIHLISYTTSPTPQDYWIASGPYIKPEIGDQVTLGYFKNSVNNMYEYSIEGYYKIISNAIDYIEGADITLNESLEGGLAQGEGQAYGVEFQLKKNTGKVFGWLSYTYSRSLRKFEEMEGQLDLINSGEYYPTIHDQPHNLSVVFNYKTGKRSTLSSNFSYSTGRPITIPISKFSYGPYLSALNYSDRNEYRMPDYHRLDISWSIKDRKVKNRRFVGEWILSVYNVYGRKNAYAIYFDKYGNANKLSILGSVFPSVSYNFKF